MALSSGNKFQALPTEKQREGLSQWIGCQRFIYNAKVNENRYFYSFSRKSLSLVGVPIPSDQQYAQFKDKELTPFLYDVPSQVLRNGAVRFQKALKNYFAGLAEKPATRAKYGRQTIWLTNELFQFKYIGKSKDKKGRDVYDHKLMIGRGKYSLGELKFKAHTEYDLPASITISREGKKWFVSLSYEISDLSLPDQDLINFYSSMNPENLGKVTDGHDVGKEIPVQSSNGIKYDFTAGQKKNLAQNEKKRKHHQKKMARQKKGSKRRKKTANKVTKLYAGESNIRKDFAHKTSRKIVDSDAEVIVFEALKIKNMTKTPEPKQAEDGSYLPNGARAKAGLNKAILASAWGNIKVYTRYKARRANKLVMEVSPHSTSQECSRCSHTHPDNRQTQAEFVCLNCGFTANADYNAALVIKKRGIRMLTNGEISLKPKKRVMRLKNKNQLGPERSEVTHVGDDNKTTCGDYLQDAVVRNRETPTTIAQAV